VLEKEREQVELLRANVDTTAALPNAA